MNFKGGEEQIEGFPLAPLIDIVFMLLIFFVATYSLQQQERELNVELPLASEQPMLKAEPEELIINITEDGKIIVEYKEWKLEELKEMLKNLTRVYSKPPAVIIRADRDVKYSRTIDVLDACATAGIHTISFVTLKKSR